MAQKFIKSQNKNSKSIASRSLISSSSSAPSRRATSRQPSTNWVVL